ncbi:MAG: hypothetical protein J6K77_06600 [Ruminococcus sp.]|nr:hypothetical protein [Ruminococcus sp.]
MSYIRKTIAAVSAAALAASMAGCTPNIGGGSRTAVTVDGYEVPAGVFIYYTMQGYDEAASVLQGNTGTAPTAKEVRNSNIDSIDSTDWIQNKATEYAVDYVNIQKEFEAIGGTLTQEEIDSAEEMANSFYAQNELYAENGVSLDSMIDIALGIYKEQAIFKHYYGFDSEEGCSEDELKDYFDENYARVKYLQISLTDSEGNKVSADEERKLRTLAEEYAEQINSKSTELEKLQEVEAVSQAYDEYKAASTTTAADVAVVTTTTTTTSDASETTTTTTTDPYANERLVKKNTTTTADAASNETVGTQAQTEEEDESTENANKFNDFIFGELDMDKAEVYDYSDEAIYVVIRGDLRERMNEDGYWTDNYITRLQSERYQDSFVKKMEEKSGKLVVEKNKRAYKRYSPFKLVLEEEE